MTIAAFGLVRVGRSASATLAARPRRLTRKLLLHLGIGSTRVSRHHGSPDDDEVASTGSQIVLRLAGPSRLEVGLQLLEVFDVQAPDPAP